MSRKWNRATTQKQRLGTEGVGVDGGEAIERLDMDGAGDGFGKEAGIAGGLGGTDTGVGTTSG